MKKVIATIILVVVVGLVFVFAGKHEPRSNNTFTIGAVLPLSGPAALWGENVKNGMELALNDHPDMKIIYADSEGKPAEGVSAFRSVQEQHPDVAVSILSTVSVPLSKIAEEEKLPLLVTLTATDNIANDYTVRYYSNAETFAGQAFLDEDSPLQNAETIAVLYRNDELGKAVLEKIELLAAEKGKVVVHTEAFNPGETEFRTPITKVKESGADALFFVPVTPVEAVGIVKMTKELDLGIPIIEASTVFADLNNRKEVAGIPFYSNIYAFLLPENAVAFKDAYRAIYGIEPNYAAAFGYDVVTALSACTEQAGVQILECIKSNQSILGITGEAAQVAPGDFNVPLRLDAVLQ